MIRKQIGLGKMLHLIDRILKSTNLIELMTY